MDNLLGIGTRRLEALAQLFSWQYCFHIDQNVDNSSRDTIILQWQM